MCSYCRDVKCGGIIIDYYRKNVLCVLNRLSNLNGENKWGFPKGHRNKDESLWKCAQREIYEETNLLIEKKKFNRPVKIHNNIYYIIILDSHDLNIKANDKKEICKVEWKSQMDLKACKYNRDLKLFMTILNNNPLSILIQVVPVYNTIKNRYNKTNKNYNKIETLFKTKNQIDFSQFIKVS